MRLKNDQFKLLQNRIVLFCDWYQAIDIIFQILDAKYRVFPKFRLIDNKNLKDHFNFISLEEYKDTFEIKK